MPDDPSQEVTLEDGVTVSPPDTPEDVKTEEQPVPSMLEDVLASTKVEEGDPSDPASEEEEGEKPTDPPPEGATDGETQPKAEEPPDTEFLQQDPDEEELKHYSQKANARIRDLVSQRNEAAQRAERVEPILEFLHQNDIPQQDLDVILDLSARLRHGDFAGFLQGVQPYVNLAMQYTGQALPADLQQQVQQGYVSPEIAKELAQRRAQVQVQQGQANVQTQQMQRQEAQNRSEHVRSAIVNWEQQIRQKDPDYDLKAEVIRRTSQAMMQEYGAPQTPEQALQLVNAAYEEVNGQMKRLRPAPKPTTTTPRSTGQQGGSAPVAEPKSMMEAAMQGLEAVQNRG